MLDDLRRSATEEPADDNPFDDEFDQPAPRAERSGFLGLSPVERMFLALFLVMDVIVIGAVILLATNRVAV
jgi:cell division protein FtsL